MSSSQLFTEFLNITWWELQCIVVKNFIGSQLNILLVFNLLLVTFKALYNFAFAFVLGDY